MQAVTTIGLETRPRWATQRAAALECRPTTCAFRL